MTDLGNEQSNLREQRTMDIAAPRTPECMITFAVTGGIFGVGRLPARLDELSQSGRIGAWHIGPWVDWRHTAIRIKFDSIKDGKLSEHVVRLALKGAASVAGPLVTIKAIRPPPSMRLAESGSDHGVLPSIFSVPFGSERLSLASVGDQQNGMPFSVISAFTRLGVDSWEETAGSQLYRRSSRGGRSR
jgi:hypothetical protein